MATAVVCAADTLHLKNGRTIVADQVREKDGRIEYEIGDNTYRIPKSLVESIDTAIPVNSLADKDLSPATPAARPADPANRAAPAPELGKNDQIASATAELLAKIVHDGKVDLDALNVYDSGKSAEEATAAYFFAGKFEAEHGDREQARRFFEHALGYLPDQPVVLTHYAAMLVQLARAREAIPFAERATRNAPESADAFMVLGYAYFTADRTRDAIPAWEKALELRPDKKVAAYLAKARREQNAEANFSERDTGRFTLRYEGSNTKDELRQQIVNTLEKYYDDLSSELGITPYQNIPVILYTEQAFFDVTQAPSWTGALNDGKLRIPVQGVDHVTMELARVLKHELAHSFINQAAGGRCPQWLNEGIAQSVEGRTIAGRGARLAQLYKTQNDLSLQSLEGSFMGFTGTEALLAYDESLAAVEYIRDTYGMGDIRRILERLNQGDSPEAALQDVMHSYYAQFRDDVRSYLVTKYGN